MDVGAAMLNRKKAKEIWNEFQKIIYEDQPYTFLAVSNNISACYKRIRGVAKGIALASVYTYWIPEAEQRVAVALVLLAEDTISPEVEPGEITEKPPEVVKPEELLEAAVKKDTTSAADTIEEVTPVPLVPPRPLVITRATPIKQVVPKYPESALTVSATGRVVVRVLVGTDGKVKATTLLSSLGNPACEAAALAAAKQWEFKPATKDGEPFEQKITIPFDFKPPR
jgi:protein TonB